MRGQHLGLRVDRSGNTTLKDPDKIPKHMRPMVRDVWKDPQGNWRLRLRDESKSASLLLQTMGAVGPASQVNVGVQVNTTLVSRIDEAMRRVAAVDVESASVDKALLPSRV
jgi:hypothetical protein